MIESPLVCIPDAIPREKRANHFALAKDLLVYRASVQEDLPDGYAIYFPSAAYDDVAQFVSNERKCCPAIQFEIEVSQEDAGIVLRMRGPEGAREFLKAELPLK